MRQDLENTNKWYADEGKFFRRISDKLIVGDLLMLRTVTHINYVKLPLPHMEKIEEYEEIDDAFLQLEREAALREYKEKYPDEESEEEKSEAVPENQ